MKDWNLDLRESPGFIEFDMEDLEKVCQCNVDAYQDYPLYPAIFGSLAGPDIIYKNWYASVRAIEGNAILVVDSKDVNGFAIFVPPYGAHAPGHSHEREGPARKIVIKVKKNVDQSAVKVEEVRK